MGGQQARQSVSSAANDSAPDEPAANTTLQCVVANAAADGSVSTHDFLPRRGEIPSSHPGGLRRSLVGRGY